MAAPPSQSLNDLSGEWVMNKELSDSAEPALALQGIGWLTRKAIGLATVTLQVKQYVGPPTPPAADRGDVTHVDIDQTATGGIKGSTERRCVDGVAREHSDWLFGRVRGRSRWVAAADVEDAFLARGWLLEGEDEGEPAGPAGETRRLLLSVAESLDNGWVATQVWGFQRLEGERRYARNVVVVKGDERVECRLVYDFIP
ncbi:hypothetical protein P8C59_003343 [Phyllachora maydis]|uniref:Uncharacterized protein n=1 Tax=Phyllachora maydis TaxID=1825666 RepID=A0AAD9MBC4_9PEZI|nr:hypothetical protein P8C59_003343 [Phyllachora maydis]